MLEKTHIVVQESFSLLRDAVTARIKLGIYEGDRGINANQMQVRGKVLRHLGKT